MESKTTCPICNCKDAKKEVWLEDIRGFIEVAEYSLICPKCKFAEGWSYGKYDEFHKPKFRWKWRRKKWK